jgi:hypothetical protein
MQFAGIRYAGNGNANPAPVQARDLEVGASLGEAGYDCRAFRPNKVIASNPAVRSVNVPGSGAGVVEEDERSFDTAKPFPPPCCVPLAFEYPVAWT